MVAFWQSELPFARVCDACDFGQVGRQLAGGVLRAFPMFSGIFANLFDKISFSGKIRRRSIKHEIETQRLRRAQRFYVWI